MAVKKKKATKKKATKKAAKKATKKVAKKATKKAAKKASTKRAKKGQKAIRYPEAKKKAVCNFVRTTNKKKGTGGIAAAVRKYKVSALTITRWLKSGR